MNQRKSKIITIGIIAVIAIIITYQFISTSIPRKTIPNDTKAYGINEYVGNDNASIKVSDVEVTKKLGNLRNLFEKLKEYDFKHQQYDPTDDKVSIGANGDLGDGYSYIKFKVEMKGNDTETSRIGLSNAVITNDQNKQKILSYMFTTDKSVNMSGHTSYPLKKGETKNFIIAYIIRDSDLKRYKDDINAVFTFPPGKKDLTGVDKIIRLPVK